MLILVSLHNVRQFDGEIGGRASEAAAAGEVIRYVGTVDVEARTASVSLVRYVRAPKLATLPHIRSA